MRRLLVHGDAARLTQVVSNLTSNAAKYTPASGEICIAAAHAGESSFELRVRDNGIGMPSEILEHVFELFVQGRQSLDRARGGLGLGLSIVRSFVERNAGTVSAHSEGAGRGSEFVITLPRAPAAAADVQPSAACHRRGGQRSTCGQDPVRALRSQRLHAAARVRAPHSHRLRGGGQ